MSDKNEGLSLAYRFSWRIRRMLMSVFGPAELGAEDDPIVRLKRERAERVVAARRAKAAGG